MGYRGVFNTLLTLKVGIGFTLHRLHRQEQRDDYSQQDTAPDLPFYGWVG